MINQLLKIITIKILIDTEHQTLLGVTGSGKTYTTMNIITNLINKNLRFINNQAICKSKDKIKSDRLKELKDLKCKKLVVNHIIGKTINVVNNSLPLNFLFNNRANGSALIEGINHIDTEYCCIINADGSMNPLYLDAMLNICSEQDFVFASRYLKPDGGSEDDTIITFIGNKIFSFLGNFIYNLDISDILFTYILGKTKSFKSLHQNKNE